MEGNLPLALIPLMAPVPLGRFLVLSFFTWSQVKGTLKQVMGLKDVSGRSAGWMACCWGRVSGVSQDCTCSMVASRYPF